MGGEKLRPCWGRTSKVGDGRKMKVRAGATFPSSLLTQKQDLNYGFQLDKSDMPSSVNKQQKLWKASDGLFLLGISVLAQGTLAIKHKNACHTVENAHYQITSGKVSNSLHEVRGWETERTCFGNARIWNTSGQEVSHFHLSKRPSIPCYCG